MRSEITWRPEALLRFLALLFMCLGMSGVAGYWAHRAIEAGFPLDEKSAAILINIFFLDVGIVAITWMMLKEHQVSWSQAFGFSSRHFRRLLLAGTITALVGFFMAAMLGGLITKLFESMGMEVSAQDVVETFQHTKVAWQRWMLGIMAVLLAPFVEELLFRGIVYTSLCQYLPRWTAMWGSAFLFGLVHANKVSLIPLTLLAVLLTKLYDRTQNLWAPMIAHAVFNSINLCLMIWLPEMIESNAP